MKTQKLITDVTQGVAVLTFIASVMIILFLAPSGNQGWGYNDKSDFRISHEICEHDLTTTQVVLFPAMSTYLFFDKNWGSFLSIIGFVMFIFFSLIAIILGVGAEKNWKARLVFILLTGYFLVTFIYLLSNGTVANQYSW